MSRVRIEIPLSSTGQPGKQAAATPTQFACLTNSRYSVHFNSLGCGYSDWGGLAVTRSSGDRTCDAYGFHIYLRDRDDNSVWSIGYPPTRVAADQYEFGTAGRIAGIVRTDGDIGCALSLCVAAEHDCELRRCIVTNRGRKTRRLDLTSYLEWVLANREADANHPAFSKLFIETRYCGDRTAIVARRRPRNDDDPQVCGFHSLVRDTLVLDENTALFETNRLAFIGRGRTLSRPRALDASATLAGHVGPVLDPIASLRTATTLEPGESRSFAFLLGAAPNLAAIDKMLAAFGDMTAIDAELHRANADAEGNSRNGTPTTAMRNEGERIIIHPAHQTSLPRHRGGPTADRFRPTSVEAAGQYTCRMHVSEPLLFDNGYGGFSADGREYVVRLKPDGRGEHRRPPMPWVNVIANERAGFLVSESGAGYMWSGNSRLNRLTAWHNDPVCDPHSEVVWIRDEVAGVFWSVTPGPTPASTEYAVRHGFGVTRFEHESLALLQETTVFMAVDEPIKITRLRLVNRSGKVRRLSVFAYAHWALGGLACETSRSVSTTYDAKLQAIFATNAKRELYAEHAAFSAVIASDHVQQVEPGFTCDRAAFLGYAGDIGAPAGLVSAGELDRRTGSNMDPCAAWQVPIELSPGGECTIVFLLGETPTRDEAATLVGKYRELGQTKQALAAVESFWQKTVSSIEIETPDPEIDLLVNGWLTYQNLSCRMWGRSAYYQPGGAFGFRDQLQDAAALIYVRPDITRAQIVCHAAQQFVEGDVLHWWHPDTQFGLRTRFSDDLLWLPYVTAGYVETTGDAAILDEEAPFVVGPDIAEGHSEAYFCPAPSSLHGTIYEHCCRALDRGLTAGAHGLPLIGCGDWNDGFSRVGRLGRGESVWLGFFIHHVLDHFVPICAQRGDDDRVRRYSGYRERLAAALNANGWDGAWYRRAYYDNGQPIGSVRSDECQIDALAQAWAVLSGVAPPDRAKMALAAVDERLVCRDAGMIKLLTPPFDRTPNEPGYIKGYLRGIRENGGQYTHGVLWVVRAMAEMGQGTAAVELLRRMSPVWHTATAERTEVYQTEPYVVAADIYGEPPHVGRGGWTWYTGSAGWMFRIAVESVFGLTIERGLTMVLKPAISAAWPCCRLTYRLPGEATSYKICIENPHGKESGVTRAAIDGSEVAVVEGVARIPLVHDGGAHRVVVWL